MTFAKRLIVTPIFALAVLVPVASAQTIRVAVLGIFHPRQIIVAPAAGEQLLLTVGDDQLPLGPGPAAKAKITMARDGGLQVALGNSTIQSTLVRLTSRSGGAARFALSVPGTITRRYLGTLEITANEGEVVPVVTMDVETAVASAVQAESAPDTPAESLKAQAVVSRSYYLANEKRHEAFDFCDLAHCQVLREPPPESSPAARAAAATRGLVLQYESHTVAALFTRSCGGQTLTAEQVGMSSSGYPYFSVRCDYCYGHPVRWKRSISFEDAATLIQGGEAGRLAINRRDGWNTIPSNSYLLEKQRDHAVLSGKGEGHGVGFCQRGAAAMARGGATFREILGHYFPNTTLAEAVPR